MSRTHQQYRRRRSPGSKLRGALLTTWEKATALAAECDCPARVSLDNPELAIVQKRHRHACPALKRRTAGGGG